jgi:hypothetical protein
VTKQPGQGIATTTCPEEGIVGADQIAGMQTDIPTAPRGVEFCATEAAFWEKHLPTITVLGHTIELGPDTHPLPEVLADRVLAADEAYLQLVRFEQWIDTASPEQIAGVIDQLRSLCP